MQGRQFYDMRYPECPHCSEEVQSVYTTDLQDESGGPDLTVVACPSCDSVLDFIA